MSCLRRSTDDGMRMDSRYLATVRRAISTCSPRKISTILSSERMGEECPSGIGVAQITLVSGPISEGRFDVSATPLPFGPRNRDQFSAAPAAVPSLNPP